MLLPHLTQKVMWCIVITLRLPSSCLNFYIVIFFSETNLIQGPSWSYGGWIYLFNQCLSPLKFEPRSWRGLLGTTLCDKVCQLLATGRWFSSGTPVISTTKTDRHNISEILLKVAVNTINLTISPKFCRNVHWMVLYKNMVFLSDWKSTTGKRDPNWPVKVFHYTKKCIWV